MGAVSRVCMTLYMCACLCKCMHDLSVYIYVCECVGGVMCMCGRSCMCMHMYMCDDCCFICRLLNLLAKKWMKRVEHKQ